MGKSEILDTSTAFERQEGVITIFTAVEYPRGLQKRFEVVYPTLEDYDKAIIIAQRLQSIGKPIGGIDILIAAMCINRSAILVTKDSHYLNVVEVEEEFKVILEE